MSEMPIFAFVNCKYCEIREVCMACENEELSCEDIYEIAKEKERRKMAEVKIVSVRKVDAIACGFTAIINCPHCFRPVDVFWSNDEEESGKVLKEECTYCAGEIQFKIEGDNNGNSDN